MWSVPTCAIRGLGCAAFAAARSSQHPFQCWTSYITAVLACGHELLIRDYRPSCGHQHHHASKLYVFSQFLKPLWLSQRHVIFPRRVLQARVFFCRFGSLFARVKSTIFVTPVKIKGDVLAFAGPFRRKVGRAAPLSVGTFAEGRLLEEQIPSFLFSLSFYHRCPYVTRATNSIFLAAEIGRISTAFFLFRCKGNAPFFSHRLFRWRIYLCHCSSLSCVNLAVCHISCLAIVARCREPFQCQIFRCNKFYSITFQLTRWAVARCKHVFESYEMRQISWECARWDECTLLTLILILCCLEESVNQV